MRVNWFSPLPPAKTAIADYTARLLPFLREKTEIVLWTDLPDWDSKLEEYAEVRHYRPEKMAWAELNRADASIYHIGNNRLFHNNIWQVSRQCPGIIVLHDVRLQHFFTSVYQNTQDRSGYLAQMELHYGEEGRWTGETFWRGPNKIDLMAERYPLTLAALENALGVIVHTPEAFDRITKENRWSVRYARLAYPASPTQNSIRAKRAARPPYRLIVFGHLGPNRRLESLVKALAGMPGKEQFRLDIYGEHYNSDELRALAQYLGAEHLGSVHGYVPDAELNDALSKAHLAINLRYPSMGEASDSQLKIWDYALPSMVTRTGWYGGLPEDSVAFVRPEHEIPDIQRHLRAFLDDPARFAKMGEKGRGILVDEHTPEKYVQATMDLVSAVRLCHLRAAAFKVADRAGSEMGAWMDSSLLGYAARKVAEEIKALTKTL
jgi:glycosyltransferase involved in cell wall biosynthesis